VSIEVLRCEDMDEREDATLAGRGGIDGVVKKVAVGLEVVDGARGALGVALPGVVAVGGENRVLTGEAEPSLFAPPRDCRAFAAVVVGVINSGVGPETVRPRGAGLSVGVGVWTFSALERGTNIPEMGVVVEKYRIPETLPSFFPGYSGWRSRPTKVPCLPFTAPTNLQSVSKHANTECR